MTIRHEKMRIAGKLVDGDTGKRIDVLNPYNNEVVGTVPRASREQIADAFELAAAYKPKLTRYERQQILTRIAETIIERKEEISDLITAECGLSKKGFAVRMRSCLRRLPPRRTTGDQRRQRSVFLRPDAARQAAQDLHPARTVARRDLGDHPVQSPAEHDFAQDRAVDCHQQLHGRQADRADPADRAAAGRHRATSAACHRKCCRSSPACPKTWATKC